MMSTPVTNPARDSDTSTQAVPRVRAIRAPLPEDGTRPLLQGAFWTLLTGVFAALAARFLFGGIGIHGPHTNSGWIALIVAMMCLPFGLMLLVLGGAKYLRKRRLAHTSR
jgi:uncharacterized RDD family membrane protein YckC